MPCFLDSPFKVASEYRIERHVRSAHRRRTPSSYTVTAIATQVYPSASVRTLQPPYLSKLFTVVDHLEIIPVLLSH